MTSAAKQLSEPAWDAHEAENERLADEMARHNHERDLWLQAYERHLALPCQGGECEWVDGVLTFACERHQLSEEIAYVQAKRGMRRWEP